MKLLLDTHAALWWLSDDARIGNDAARQLTDETNQVLLSSTVVWEVAIKRALGKLRAPEDVATVLAASSFGPLSISIDHATLAGSLPSHHRDPFDRLLIAQATLDSLTIVTRDPRFAVYGVPLLPA